MLGPDERMGRGAGRQAARQATHATQQLEPVGDPHAHLPILAGAEHGAGQGVGEADEPGGEQAGGLAVDRGRRPGLLDPATVHQGDPVGDDHRLLLVMGDIDGGDAQPLLQLPQLEPHVLAKLGVEVAQRLVEQQHARLERHGAGQRDPLLLAAAELVDAAVAQLRQVHEVQRAAHARRDVGAGHGLQLQAEGDVLGDGHVRPDRVGLEHHAHATLLGRDGAAGAADDRAVHQDAPAGHVLKPGDAAQRRGLAAAARTQQHKELAFGDHQVNRVHGRGAAVGLAHAVQGDAAHAGVTPWCPGRTRGPGGRGTPTAPRTRRRP